MGWWSATIMGGDTPLDMLARLCGVAGAPWGPDTLDSWEPGHVFDGGDFHLFLLRRHHIEGNLDKLVAELESIPNTYGDQRIAVQVFGAMVLHTGAAIPDDLRERIIESAKADEWASEGDAERQQYIDNFVAALRAHEPGRPHHLTEEGLLSQIERVLH